jgi:hypothetical protein
MNDLHDINFSDRELEIINQIGKENEDYAICAVFEHRNNAEIEYDEEKSVITIYNGDIEITQSVSMITEVAESSDPLERIGVGVSMLEVAKNMEQQFLVDAD